jgi:uroporphyrinogen III methyltransferase/synthase
MPQPPYVSEGKVYLVGAGPGDPGLVTLRGIECLAQAELVLYDYLVNPQIVEHAAAGAQLVCLGRHGLDRLLTQDEINDRMIAGARAGQTVVRLKSGDPMIFGRVADEVQALVAAGVDFEIVPGVTAATALGAYAGIPLTHRELASAVAFVTGHEDSAKDAPVLDYSGLSQFPGTLVFYMAVTTAPTWTKALLDGGRPPTTPAAIVRRCSWPDQQVIRCQLGEVASVIAEQRIRPPVLAVVGEVAAVESSIHWFSRRPLFGKRIVVTRAAGQAGELRRRLEQLGATVLIQPAIQITAPESWNEVDRAIAQLDGYDWLVFSSVNGVRYFLERLLATTDLRRLSRAMLAAIGPGTAQALAEYHLKVDLLPDEYRAEALAAALVARVRDRRVLLLRASRGREVLAQELQAAGARVEQVVVYQSYDVEHAEPQVLTALRAGRVDYLTVTSSAIARSAAKLFGADLHRAKLASISPLTSATLREAGARVDVEARSYTMEGLVAAILDDVRPSPGSSNVR